MIILQLQNRAGSSGLPSQLQKIMYAFVDPSRACFFSEKSRRQPQRTPQRRFWFLSRFRLQRLCGGWLGTSEREKNWRSIAEVIRSLGRSCFRISLQTNLLQNGRKEESSTLWWGRWWGRQVICTKLNTYLSGIYESKKLVNQINNYYTGHRKFLIFRAFSIYCFVICSVWGGGGERKKEG